MVLLREIPGGVGFEVFLVKRAQAIAFMGGAHVFPGGRVDPKTDASIEAAAVREVREEVGVTLPSAGLRLFARWVTPEIEPRRFDARFFVAAFPAGQRAAPDEGEVVEGAWFTPRAALEANEAGRIILPPPTLWTLLDLAALATVPEVFLEAERRVAAGLELMAPRAVGTADGRICLVLPGDPAYDDPAVAVPRDHKALRRFELEENRWRAYGHP